MLLLTLDSPEFSQVGTPPVILVVEDEVLVRNFVCLQLQRDGYQVLAAADGVEALDVARAFTGTIHMLVTDVVMPRMDGLALAQRMLEERPGMRVLVMSGKLSGASREQTVELPFLQKPFPAKRLREKIKEVLKNPPPEARRS
ncbi:MAG: response regulator [Acidobacteriia bacterium]|nr:response regulator [Terriglobia bacterium]MBV8904874.1 response regulator [Terriglobia bacterium]